MSANALFLIILIVTIIGTLALATVSVKWGLKWAKVAEISFERAFGLYLFFISAALLIGICLGILIIATKVQISESTLDILGYAGQFIVPCIVIAMVYKVGLWRAGLATIPYCLVTVASLLLALAVIRPFVYEAFVIPTNAMAPTLLGEHWEAPCSRCGSPAYGSPIDARGQIPPNGVQLICSNEFQTVYVKDVPKIHGSGDRILVSKQLTPRRWDLIVFRYPEDPSINYVKRLIGLPGEKLEIRDGAVWINSEKLETPASIRGIRYSPTIESHGQIFSGPGSNPVELGPDEFFVLGDFVDASADSRFWEQGAPGHPPYAVPASHIVGVVINVYWPINRWRAFR